MECYSAMKKNEIMRFIAIKMDLEIVTWSENKSDREGEIVYDIPYMQNLKRNGTSELMYVTGTDSQT